MEATEDLLEKYKRQPFAKGLLPLSATLAEIGTPTSKIVAKQEGRQRWVICDKVNGKPALFSHATRYAEGDRLDTGNYVPDGLPIPVGLDPKGIQRRANTRCFYTFVFDTYGDLSLYEGQWSLDEYIEKVQGFNPTSLPRRAYLSGKDEKYRSRFWMQTPMFLRKKENANLEHLHPWVIEADKTSKVFSANPDRPRVWVKVGDDIVPIEETEPGFLQRGDVLAISFTVTYHISSVNWFPQFHPADIVVLRSDGEATDYSGPAMDLRSRPPPTFEDDQDGNSVGEVGKGVVEGGLEGPVLDGDGPKDEVAGGGPSVVESSERAFGDEDDKVASGSRGSSQTVESSQKGVGDVANELEYVGSDVEGDGEVQGEEFEDAVGESLKRRARGGRSGRSTRRRV